MAEKEKKKKAEKEEAVKETVKEETAEPKEAEAKEPDERDEMIDSLKDKILRISAEYDNYRKRTQKEKDSLYSVAKADTVAAFLPLLDNIE